MAETLMQFLEVVRERHVKEVISKETPWGPVVVCHECHSMWPCDSYRIAQSLTPGYVAMGLHETARLNHNLGEGPARAICQQPSAHVDRANAMLEAITMKEDT